MAGKRLTLSADGTTDFVEVYGPAHVSLTGDIGTGTAKVQAKDPGGNTVDIAGSTTTAIADKVIDFPADARNEIAVNLASSTAPALVVWIQGEGR